MITHNGSGVDQSCTGAPLKGNGRWRNDGRREVSKGQDEASVNREEDVKSTCEDDVEAEDVYRLSEHRLCETESLKTQMRSRPNVNWACEQTSVRSMDAKDRPNVV